jgi:hypothetical protein
MVVQGASFTFLLEFGALSWFLLIAAAIINLFSSTTKFIAYKYHKASELQTLNFLPNVWQFCIDITFMKCTFSALELTGFFALFIFYGIYLSVVAASTCLKSKVGDDEFNNASDVSDIELGATSCSPY